MRSVAQSPPPTTFPARAVASATPCSARRAGAKKLRRYAEVSTSAAPFDAEYRSWPPMASSSPYPSCRSRFSYALSLVTTTTAHGRRASRMASSRWTVPRTFVSTVGTGAA